MNTSQSMSAQDAAIKAAAEAYARSRAVDPDPLSDAKAYAAAEAAYDRCMRDSPDPPSGE